MQWIIDNKEWVFSGIGVFVISLIAAVIFKGKKTASQTQKSGKNSKNYQAAGNINIGTKDD